jgi:pyrroline-5-carboxylate reductase
MLRRSSRPRTAPAPASHEISLHERFRVKDSRQYNVVFIGGGRITSALIAGLRLSDYGRPIVVHDRHPQKLRELRLRHDVVVEPDLYRAVEQAHILIIAVRPDSVRGLLQRLDRTQPGRTRPILAVSLAAGIPLKNLRSWIGPPIRWARAMPSPVARSGHGLTALAFERGFPASARREIWTFYAHVGNVFELPESKFDAFTVTYSSSHGYHALDALAGAAVKMRLDRKTALTAAAHALADGIQAWRDSGLSLSALRHEAATPGGIAATTMAKMDQLGYKRVVEKGLQAGISRAKKNART